MSLENTETVKKMWKLLDEARKYDRETRGFWYGHETIEEYIVFLENTIKKFK